MVWVFGYGSLVWRPDFPFSATTEGWVEGYGRRFWQGSPDHRGTPAAPGRVVTLVESPHERVWGRAYRVERAVLGHLDQREVAGYDHNIVRVSGVEALVYRAIEGNPSWLGPAPLHVMVDQVLARAGKSGPNVEYVLRLDEALHAAGAPDPHVTALAEALRATR